MDRRIIYSKIRKREKTPPPDPENKENPPKNKKALFALGFFLVGGFFVWLAKPEAETGKENPKTILGSEAELQEDFLPEEKEEKKIVHTVEEGDIPAEVLAKKGGLDANQTQSLLSASDGIYDFTKIKIGQNLEFVFDEEDNLEKIRYFPDNENMVVAETKENSFEVKKEKIPYETEEKFLHFKIDEFLYKDGLDAGLTEASLLQISDIFSFDIDFTTEIREGDEAWVLYEKRTLKGEPAPDGKILAAKFKNAGKEYFAYYFESEGRGGHYDPDGKELARQFLRAPLSYRRITSGFSGARLHPITKKVTAHYQIDYSAPVGTPVVATARGTVSSAGWEGGWGNMVRLRHDNGYSTHYAHLSAYGKGIKSGSPVSQGQIIGYVGSTGWSTGPHLDYGMKLNGSPVNPLSLQLPKGNPLSGNELEKFREAKAIYQEKFQ